MAYRLNPFTGNLDTVNKNDHFSNTIFVDISGDNVTGDGTLHKPFADLTGAYDAILSGDFPNVVDDQIAIVMMAGNYSQDPVDFSGLNPQINIIGQGFKTQVNANDPDSDLITLGNNGSLLNIAVGGVTALPSRSVVRSRATLMLIRLVKFSKKST